MRAMTRNALDRLHAAFENLDEALDREGGLQAEVLQNDAARLHQELNDAERTFGQGDQYVRRA